MMDLIDRAELFKRLKLRERAYGEKSYDGFHMAVTADVVANMPTVDAVPLDKLCEWLERYATMDCDGCRETVGSCEDEENQKLSVCNSRERWKAMLTKWMEGLDGTD